ncbi:MAG: hypothetical protein LBK61_07585 [Spirochaetaceae bacterium]|nr:hypothetical protein [Spirochaetaceae bacterium]
MRAPAEGPCRGAKTRRVFIPLRIISDVNHTPILAEESAVGGHALWWLCFPRLPLRGAKTLRVFIPLRIISDANPVPT